MKPFVRTSVYLILVATLFSCKDLLKPVPVVTSPNQKLITSVQVKNGIPFFKVDKDNNTLLKLTPIQFFNSKGDSIHILSEIGEITASFNRSNRIMPIGQKRVQANIYNEMTVQFNSVEESKKPLFLLRCRMYDDLVAFRIEPHELDSTLIARVQMKHEGQMELFGNVGYLESISPITITEQPSFVHFGNVGKARIGTSTEILLVRSKLDPKIIIPATTESVFAEFKMSSFGDDWVTLNVQSSARELLLSDANFMIQDEISQELKEELSWSLDELNRFGILKAFDVSHFNYSSKKAYSRIFSENIYSEDFAPLPWVHLMSSAIFWTPSFNITHTDDVQKLRENQQKLLNLMRTIPSNWADSKLLRYDEKLQQLCIARKFPDSENWIIATLNGSDLPLNTDIDLNFINTRIGQIQQYTDTNDGNKDIEFISIDGSNQQSMNSNFPIRLQANQASILFVNSEKKMNE